MTRLFKMVVVLVLFFGTNVFAQSTLDALAIEHLRTITSEGQYSPKDVADPLITDSYTSRGIAHVYLKQQYEGIPIEHTSAGVHFTNGNVVSANMTLLSGGDISHSDIKVKLVYTATQKNALVLAWDIAINEKQGTDWLNFIVDANSGEILKEISWTVHCLIPIMYLPGQ